MFGISKSEMKITDSSHYDPFVQSQTDSNYSNWQHNNFHHNNNVNACDNNIESNNSNNANNSDKMDIMSLQQSSLLHESQFIEFNIHEFAKPRHYQMFLQALRYNGENGSCACDVLKELFKQLKEYLEYII